MLHKNISRLMFTLLLTSVHLIIPSQSEPLFDAIRENNLGAIKALIAAGVNINQENRYGHTPLIHAAYWGRIDTVRALIAASAKVNQINTFGETALMFAAGSGGTDTVQALIAAGAEVNQRNNFGKTASYIARDENVGAASIMRAITQKQFLNQPSEN